LLVPLVKVKGVQSIVWKVRSIETAERYLKEAKAYGRSVEGRIKLDKARMFGLLIYLAGD
jgi:hypothetical protein